MKNEKGKRFKVMRKRTKGERERVDKNEKSEKESDSQVLKRTKGDRVFIHFLLFEIENPERAIN